MEIGIWNQENTIAFRFLRFIYFPSKVMILGIRKVEGGRMMSLVRKAVVEAKIARAP